MNTLSFVKGEIIRFLTEICILDKALATRNDYDL